MTFGVLVRKRGAIGVFDWHSVQALSEDDAVRIAHDNDYEVNGVTTGFNVVGVYQPASRFPKLEMKS